MTEAKYPVYPVYMTTTTDTFRLTTYADVVLVVRVGGPFPNTIATTQVEGRPETRACWHDAEGLAKYLRRLRVEVPAEVGALI